MKDDQKQESILPQRYIEIRQRKTEKLIEYLRCVQELNRQLQMFEISEEIKRIDKAHDRALDELFKKKGM